MLNKIRGRINALGEWFHDMFVFWVPLERRCYVVKCPYGHQTELTRDEVLALDFTQSQLAAIEWGFSNENVVNVRATDCPHAECIAREARWARRRKDPLNRLA